METVFHISNFLPKYQVKYASCTLLDGALTWWNSHKRTVGVDVAYAMMWKALMKLMTEDAIRITNNLMDQKLKGYAVKNAKNKRRFNNNPRDNRGQQQQLFKRQNVNSHNVARACTVGNNVERKAYIGALPYYNKCIMHHEGPCTVKCGNCNRVGHMTRDCRTVVTTTP
ncbi:putative reverse transcriptase domain-containing protein [Tanacetum coccineum]